MPLLIWAMAPKFSLFTERNVVIFIRLHGEEIYFGEKQPPDLIQSCAQPSMCILLWCVIDEEEDS